MEIDELSYSSIDSIIRESKRYALTNNIKEIRAYCYLENRPSDSTLCLIEKYNINGAILYKKDFHYKNVKDYAEYFYTYDSIGRLISIKTQNTFELPAFKIFKLNYNSEGRVSEFQRKYDSFNYTYYQNGLIKALNNGEYIYDKDWKLKYILRGTDTIYSYQYDLKGCEINSFQNDFVKIYSVRINSAECQKVEELLYFYKGNVRNKLPFFKVTFKYSNGRISEELCYHESIFGQLKVSKKTSFKYNNTGLLVSEIEYKAYGKNPRIKNYYYK